MDLATPDTQPELHDLSIIDRFRDVRRQTLALCEGLEAEDCVVQTMPDVSPTKWHLAHTSWFFENFLLKEYLEGYRVFDEQYGYIFNSYYYTVGQMHARPSRGHLSRPTVAEIRDYREHIDKHLQALLDGRGDDEHIAFLTTLGCHHEQQHQELILTDIKHVFAQNPLYPALRDTSHPPSIDVPALRFIDRPGGIIEIGHAGPSFAFDNETPRHRVMLNAHRIASRPTTNTEYREFIRDGGYQDASLWLSDGWAVVQQQGWTHPLYWSDDLEQEYTLGGMRPLNPGAPVVHVSYYEADAYARWAGMRLPTETELEAATAGTPVAGNLLESGLLHPAPATGHESLAQLYGDVWEWTMSPYMPYPGFRPLSGSLGEYNGKFMCNQVVLRGGSCATPASHIRPSYRNFFYPDARWQFSGIRLAQDVKT